jgi:hypothetical protein
MSVDADAQSESISFSRTQPNPVQLPKYYSQIPQPSTSSAQPSKCEEKKKKKKSTDNVSGWRAKAESTEEEFTKTQVTPKQPQPSTLSPQPSKGKEKKQVSGWRERAETETTEEDPFFLAMIDKVNKDHENKMAFENFGKRKRNLNITDFECGNCEKCKRKK